MNVQSPVTRREETDTLPGGATRSVLLINASPEIAQLVERACEAIGNVVLESESTPLAKIGEHPINVANGRDLIIADIDPDSRADRNAIAELLAGSQGAKRFIALIESDLPLSEARKLTRLGIDEVLPLSVDLDELQGSMRALLAPPPTPPAKARPPAESVGPEKRGAIISVARARGGSGATSVAVNLAATLLQRRGMIKKRPSATVALADLDLQFGDVATLLDLEDRGVLAQIATSATPPDTSYLESAMAVHSCGLHVLGAPTEAVPLDALTVEHVAAILDGLSRQYDYVVIDMPHALVTWLEPVLKRSTLMLIVTDTSVPAIRQCRRLIDFFTEENADLAIEIVVNRERRPVMLSAAQKEAARVLDRKLTHWLPRNDAVMRRAVDRGVPTVLLAPSTSLSRAYAALAVRIRRMVPAGVETQRRG